MKSVPVSGDIFNIKPDQVYVEYFSDDQDTGELDVQCCDSRFALLLEDKVDEWIKLFSDTVASGVVNEYCETYTATLVFNICGSLKLVMVSESGGEYMGVEFEKFCSERKIDFQYMIDSPDMTDVSIDEVYTGLPEEDNNLYLLGILHQICNFSRQIQ